MVQIRQAKKSTQATSIAEQVAGFKAFIRGEPVDYLWDKSEDRWLRLRGNDTISRNDIIRPAPKRRKNK